MLRFASLLVVAFFAGDAQARTCLAQPENPSPRPPCDDSDTINGGSHVVEDECWGETLTGCESTPDGDESPCYVP